MLYIPFVAYFEIQEISGKRTERTAELQQAAQMIYEALLSESDINIATPGGSQTQASTNAYGAISNLTYACGVKPSFGDTPAQAMINGFYSVNRDNIQTYQQVQLISSGEVFTANRQSNFNASPSSTVESEVKSLKEILDSAIATLNIECSVYKLEYNGVRYGAKGLHFPR